MSKDPPPYVKRPPGHTSKDPLCPARKSGNPESRIPAKTEIKLKPRTKISIFPDTSKDPLFQNKPI